ncbi:MAG: dihydrofolate reductase [Acidobacteria bacterium]|nr:dihydrofolate reductase [Acidobacteriota bacterium]
MRKLIFGGANSLDNFFARKDGSVDWLLFNDEVAEVMKGSFDNVDIVLLGRKTFEVALKHGGGKSQAMPGITSYVFSRTWKESPDPNAQLVTTDAVEFVRALKAQSGKNIILMGGGDFARTLFEADLIDEIGFNIHPVLLGSGIPIFFEMSRQIDLQLIECKTFKTGCVLVRYAVKHR